MNLETEYVNATKTIARILILMSREDADDEEEFDDLLEDYTGDVLQQVKEEIHTQLMKEDK